MLRIIYNLENLIGRLRHGDELVFDSKVTHSQPLELLFRLCIAVGTEVKILPADDRVHTLATTLVKTVALALSKPAVCPLGNLSRYTTD